MTYNFDPDRWYDNQRALLEHRRTTGEISDAEFEQEVERLEQRYDEMLQRQSAPFDLPPGRTNPDR